MGLLLMFSIGPLLNYFYYQLVPIYNDAFLTFWGKLEYSRKINNSSEITSVHFCYIKWVVTTRYGLSYNQFL